MYRQNLDRRGILVALNAGYSYCSWFLPVARLVGNMIYRKPVPEHCFLGRVSRMDRIDKEVYIQ